MHLHAFPLVYTDWSQIDHDYEDRLEIDVEFVWKLEIDSLTSINMIKLFFLTKNIKKKILDINTYMFC